ncbi:histone deacetylase [Streptomyces sp. NPDC101160]|uniref:histone deacetylase n=1 Tax=Streptomyces sp. NPDC101160 TaxID=3366118 RepID=UPI003821205E
MVAEVWYVAYGSNMCGARLSRYLARCRDRCEPRESRAVVVPGAVYFATESAVWGGGRGFYDPGADGVVWARAHLLTAGQFSDIVAQEMYREVGGGTGGGGDGELDLAAVVACGRVEFGTGRYETVVCAGELDGLPMLTFTAPWAMDEVEHREPSEAYLRLLVAGLREAGAWSADEIAGYLAALPGAVGRWSAEEILGIAPTPSGEPD